MRFASRLVVIQSLMVPGLTLLASWPDKAMSLSWYLVTNPRSLMGSSLGSTEMKTGVR